MLNYCTITRLKDNYKLNKRQNNVNTISQDQINAADFTK